MGNSERQREYIARRMILTQLWSVGYIDAERYTRLMHTLDLMYKDVSNADKM